MRSFGQRLVAGSATLLALLGFSVGPAFGDRYFETVYVQPTSYVVPTTYIQPTSYSYAPTSYVVPSSYSYVPTSYVVPSSYSYVPTSYVVPTSRVMTATNAVFVPSSYSYVPTSYVVPSSYSYVPTSYVVPSSYSTTAYTTTDYVPSAYTTTVYRRPGLLRRLGLRPMIETTRSYNYDVVPTTYYSPTTIAYDAAVTATSLTMAGPCSEAVVPFNPPPVSNGNGAETSKSITSTPRDNGEPTYNEKATPKAVPKVKATEPPPDPAPEKDGLAPPADPPKTGDIERTSFKPKYTEVKPKVGATAQAVLQGEVVSGVTGAAQEGLQVIFTDLKARFQDKIKTTNAKGAFEIYLPEGTWSYRIVNPKAAVGTAPTEYGSITSTGGRYLDENDAPLYGLRINR